MVLKEASQPRSKPLDIGPNDIVMALMGMTGAGKSTFIQYFTDENVGIGDGLESFTDKVAIFPCTLPNGTEFYLADTPGFDDTNQSDTDILREVARWLNEAYTEKISLTGIIYLQKISDNRVGGAGSKNLRMFKKLCGESSLASVVLATTMWSEVNPEAGNRRELQLQTSTAPKPDFWKSMIDLGSRVLRQDREKESAEEIINYLIENKRPVKLDIVEEMMVKQKTLDETAAGREVQDEIERQRLIYERKMETIREEMITAANERDRERQKELREEKEKYEKKRAQDIVDLQNLQATNEQLQQQRRREEDVERARYNEEIREQTRRLAEADADLRVMQIKMEQQSKNDALKRELENNTLKRDVERAEIARDTARKDRDAIQKKYDSRCTVM